MQSIVIPHKQNYTDAVCSAVAYTSLQRILTKKNVTCVVTNPLNSQTEFLLKKFPSKLIETQPDLHPRAKHLVKEQIISLRANDSIARALELYSLYGFRQMPVLEDSGKCMGLLEFTDLFSVFTAQRDDQSIKIKTSTHTLLETVNGSLMSGKPNNNIQEFMICTATGSQEYFLKQIQKVPKSQLQKTIFVSSFNPQVNRSIVQLGAAALILCPVVQPNSSSSYLDDEAVFFQPTCTDPVDHKIDDVTASDSVVIETKLAASLVTILIKQSSPISLYAQTSPDVFVSLDRKLEDIRIKFKTTDLGAVLVQDQQGQLKSIITRQDLLTEDLLNITTIGCVNNDDAPEGIDDHGVQIERMITHTSITGIDTSKPLEIVVRPFGSTSTLVSKMFVENNIVPTPEVAGLLLGGIIAQTKHLRSVTTTLADVQQAERLSIICNVSADFLGHLMLRSDETESVKARLERDVKEYSCNNGIVRVSQMETMDLEGMTNEQLDEINDLLSLENVWLSCVMVTDILKEVSILIMKAREQQVYDQINRLIGYSNFRDNAHCIYLPNIISRKKQLMPHLLQTLQQIILE